MGRGRLVWGIVLLALGIAMIIIGVLTTSNPGSALVSYQAGAEFWYVLIPGCAVAAGGGILVIYQAFHQTQ